MLRVCFVRKIPVKYHNRHLYHLVTLEAAMVAAAEGDKEFEGRVARFVAKVGNTL